MGKKKGKTLHVIQGISLIVAGGLLWVHPFINHTNAMIVSLVIIGGNALIEIFS